MKISQVLVSLFCLVPVLAQSQYGMYGAVPPCNCNGQETHPSQESKPQREQQRRVEVARQMPSISQSDKSEAQRAMALKIVKVAGREADPRAARESLNPSNELGYSVLVLDITLDAEGHVVNISVVRPPSKDDAQDTIDLAISAVHKAAPYRGITRGVLGFNVMQTFIFSKNRKFYINALMN